VHRELSNDAEMSHFDDLGMPFSFKIRFSGQTAPVSLDFFRLAFGGNYMKTDEDITTLSETKIFAMHDCMNCEFC